MPWRFRGGSLTWGLRVWVHHVVATAAGHHQRRGSHPGRFTKASPTSKFRRLNSHCFRLRWASFGGTKFESFGFQGGLLDGDGDECAEAAALESSARGHQLQALQASANRVSCPKSRATAKLLQLFLGSQLVLPMSAHSVALGLTTWRS